MKTLKDKIYVTKTKVRGNKIDYAVYRKISDGSYKISVKKKHYVKNISDKDLYGYKIFDNKLKMYKYIYSEQRVNQKVKDFVKLTYPECLISF